jgi:threonine dehydrogenase-like Zn-dependent dehydrogenase
MYAARAPGIGLAEPVAVLGQGMIGLICTQLARISGALPLVGIDIVDDRLKLARQCGADLAFNAKDPAALKAAMAQLPGGGVDVVIELTAVAPSVELGFEIARQRARVFLGSLGKSGWRADIYGPMWRKGLQIIGGYVNAKPHALTQTKMVMQGWPPDAVPGPVHFGPGSWTSEADTYALFELLRHKRIQIMPLITHNFKPQDAERAFAMLGINDPSMLGALFHWR